MYSNGYDWKANSAWPLTTACEAQMVAANHTAEFRRRVQTVVDAVASGVPYTTGLFGAAVIESPVQVYAVGQCLITDGIIDPVDCGRCLQSAKDNIMACPPAAGARSAMLECFLRYSDQPFFNVSKVTLFHIHHDHEGRKQNTIMIVGILCVSVAVAFSLIFITLVYFIRYRKTKRSILDIYMTFFIESGLTELRQPVSFHYNDLCHATQNFNDKCKLGQGGFASVYKGIINDRIVAVKKLKIEGTTETREGFEREIVLLSNTRHRNLVSLLGYCRKDSDLLLVYEFMEKGSLDKILFGDSRDEKLSWRQRFDIIVGIARGITYLHEDFCVPIIHRDIKCGNILLDDKLQAKIGDFGLARLFPENQSHIRSRLAGTIGYTAPEYMLRGHLSEKVDIYSFGILVLEIISRRKCNDLSTEPYLLEQAWRYYEANSLVELVDRTLEIDEFDQDEMMRVIHVGLMCTQSPHLRPIMSEVVAKLMNTMDGISFDLLRPSFITAASQLRPDDEEMQAATDSGGMSISHFSGR